MPKPDLSTRQRRGLASLMTSRTIPEAAQAAGVTERTFYRWLVLPAFAAELKTRQAGIIDQAAGRLVQELSKAIETLAELRDGAKGEGVRRQAASELIDKCFAIREQTDLEKRLSDLERQAKL
jgi:hypothetical protein